MDTIRDHLEAVKHPEINNTLVELGMIGEVSGDARQVTVELKLPMPNVPILDILIQLISSALKDVTEDVQVKPSVMSPDEKERFFNLARQNWAG